MISSQETEAGWGSRRVYLMVILCQMLGIPMFVGLTNTAITTGATGYSLCHIAASLLAGVPLLYMEFIISQFTARDFIDVWKVHACLSHIGYLLVFWQIIQILYNHIMNAFVFHYLLISFENPIPYYTCGSWATNSCNILMYNYTVNQDCLKQKKPVRYCDHLYTTFPEYQYWRYSMMGVRNVRGHIAWRVCLASALICAITYISVFKRKQSVKWVINFFTLFPIFGYVVLLMGSMVQKGVVVKYDDALDSDFTDFVENFSFSTIIVYVVYILGIGSGIPFNLSCSSDFRAACYSDTVIAVVVLTSIGTLLICFTAMMACPYAYEYGIDPDDIMKTSLSLLFEKTPRYLYEYQHKHIYLVLIYTCHTALGIGSNMILILHFMEMAIARSAMIAKYPGLVSFFLLLCLFSFSIPLMGSNGVNMLIALKQNSNVFALFVAVIEAAVFVLWYGLDKFSEDVHFMQGLRPKSYFKLCWVGSIPLLMYTFCTEAYSRTISSVHSLCDTVGLYVLFGSIGLVVFIFVLQLVIAAFKKKVEYALRLDPTWGPKSELLQRSRAMFTAQAMTKEYLYRQYHLQAGIAARQRISNCTTSQ